MYTAYDLPLMQKLEGIVTKLGIIVIVLALIAVFLCFFSKKARKLTLFCACAAVVSSICFLKVQQFDRHHIYIIATEFCILMMLGIWQITELLRNRTQKEVAATAFSALLIVGSLNCFVPSTRKFTSPVSGLYSYLYEPHQRNDIHELRSLTSYVNNLTDSQGKHVYVLASSGILNDDLLRALDKPQSNDAFHNSYATAHVDLRDGFNADFLKADYVIITDPVQLHTADGTQEVVRFLDEEVKNQKSPVGKHFTKKSEGFNLDDGVTAYVYEKISEFEEFDLEYIAEHYTNYYPGKEELFEDRILKR